MEATSDIALFSQQPNKVPVDGGSGCFQAAREGMDAVNVESPSMFKATCNTEASMRPLKRILPKGQMSE